MILGLIVLSMLSTILTINAADSKKPGSHAQESFGGTWGFHVLYQHGIMSIHTAADNCCTGVYKDLKTGFIKIQTSNSGPADPIIVASLLARICETERSLSLSKRLELGI